MTEQFTTAKISSCALKQESEIHLAPRQRSSQLQKHQIAQTSRRIREQSSTERVRLWGCDWAAEVCMD